MIPASRPREGHGGRVLIIGAGSIGMSLAIVFARADWDVCVFDLSVEARDRAIDLAESKRAAAGERAALPLRERVRVSETLDASIADVDLVIECAPERLSVKQDLFAQLEGICPAETIFASVSSTIPISQSAGHLATRARTLVAHPVNPPHLVPIIELVPAPFTESSTLARARAIFDAVGMTPVVLRTEIEGFVVNRLQAAVLREAMHLVGEGIADPAGIDLVVREALAPRWVIGGPFETADLNTRGGFAAHAATIGHAYSRFGEERAGRDAWASEIVESVTAFRRDALPLENWGDAVLERERRIAAVLRMLEHITPPEGNPPHA